MHRPTPLPDPPSRARRRPAAVLGTLALVAVTATGCFGGGGDDSSGAAPTSGASASGGSPPMASRITVSDVAGIHIKKAYAKHFHKGEQTLERRVGKAVDAWFDGAYVGVSYPRDDFADAFSSFTTAAAQDAQRQKRLMTNWPLRQSISGVTTTHRRIRLDVLAPQGHVAGVTARVVLRFTTTPVSSGGSGGGGSSKDKKVTVTGRLFLTRDDSGQWKIFGFDVSKGAT